ncbi:beta-trefoil DNA-binding domain-containing protein [Radiomyces spectabilis]|uniref:beta-trefoil DNA-binding domain-containing protein n=1 Tax=Radiomyces spectabilis TaxID=64574 RepID=UPI002220365A|nr:beta-trefoil DNA-binding domain-containing protein [Radiomyces spectabilis]KAI8373100.1 beta-trefoil DNA-binding domain-containing protein [Radiomyces spectabilis]
MIPPYLNLPGSASTLPASPPMTRRTNTISCLHAVVAQKSYGSEKRFLCPPPIVSIKGDFHDQPLVSMSVICDGANEKPTEQHTLLDEHMQGSFKYLHASGVTKSKQFYLKVDLRPNVHNNSNNNATNASHPSSPSPGTKPYATFLSMPISLISKPSKKTAKARNISTCFLANSMVALYNRINSQTVRTKYMTSEKGRLCGKASSWSAFKILVLQQPQNHNHGRMIRSYAPPSQTPAHITYGTEIILEDVNTGVTSPPLILRKVEKGHIASCSFAPMNQMQKVALQLSSSVGKEPMYLSCDRVSPSCQGDVVDDANNNYAHSATIWLDFFRSRCLADGKEAVDDFLCWTIVGVSRFEYTYAEPDVVEASSWSPSCPAPPSLSPSSSSSSTWQPLSQPSPPPSPPRSLMPFPFLTSVQYISSSHSLRIQGQHLMQSISSSTSRLLEFWLGAHGPLKVTEPENDPHQDLFVELPNTHDLLVANHNLLTTQPDGSRYLELPLLLVRHDGIAYHSGKALACDIVDDAGRWHVVAATMSS